MKRIYKGLRRTIFLNLLIRIVILVISCLGVIYLVTSVLGKEMVFSLLVGSSLILIQIKLLADYVLKINKSLVQFIDSGVFTEEGETKFKRDNSQISDFEIRVNQLKDDIGRSRFEGQKHKFLLKNAMDEMEHSLVCVNNGSEVIFANKAFRKLIGGAEIYKLSELDDIYPELGSSIRNINPVMPGIVSLSGFKASLRCKEFIIGSDNISLYSIQNIQQEIDKNEIESWERLIKVLTHEIMNSLSPIISLSKSMQSSMQDQEKIISGLSAIENTGEGLINFISEYRKLSDLPPPEKEYFKISELFGHIGSLFRQECNLRKIKFQILQEDKNLKLYAEKFQIEQVLVNLITNSMEVLSDTEDSIIILSVQSDSETIQICVEDNGPGIPKDNMDKIFIPFFSTKKKGIGIGLSLSKQILTNHSAVIQISSDPGVSTKFILRFSG